MSSDDGRFSRFERLLLANQLLILEALYPDEAEDLATVREALENGYELLYRWQIERIYTGDDVMTADECLEVWNTLDMFDAINRAIEKLELVDLRDSLGAKFRGYDGNNESKFLGFVTYTFIKLKRFEYVPLAQEGSFNSHAPMRDVYGRMYEVWSSFDRDSRFNLSEKQLCSVLNAAIHPEQRQDYE